MNFDDVLNSFWVDGGEGDCVMMMKSGPVSWELGAVRGEGCWSGGRKSKEVISLNACERQCSSTLPVISEDMIAVVVEASNTPSPSPFFIPPLTSTAGKSHPRTRLPALVPAAASWQASPGWRRRHMDRRWDVCLPKHGREHEHASALAPALVDLLVTDLVDPAACWTACWIGSVADGAAAWLILRLAARSPAFSPAFRAHFWMQDCPPAFCRRATCQRACLAFPRVPCGMSTCVPCRLPA